MRTDCISSVQANIMLTTWIAALTTPKVRLCIVNVALTPLTPITSLTEPTASWYTAAALTYGDPYDQPDGSWIVTAGSVQFNYSGTDAGITIYSWFVTDETSPKSLISSAHLAQATTMQKVGDGLVVYPQLVLPPLPESLS